MRFPEEKEKMPATSSPPWGTQVEDDVDTIEGDKAFKTPDKTKRTPVTSHAIPNAIPYVAPKKPSSSSKATTEHAHSTTPTHGSAPSPSKACSTKSSPMKVLLKTAINTIHVRRIETLLFECYSVLFGVILE